MSAASVRSVAVAVAWRNVHNFLTYPRALLPVLLFPLFFFVSFAGILSPVSTIPGFDFPSGYTAFEFVFVVLQSAAGAGGFTGFAITIDFESRFSRRLMLAAPNRLAIVAGYVIAALAQWLLILAVLIAVAAIGGIEIGGTGVDLFGLFALGVLVNIASTLWAAGIAMRLRSIEGGALIQLPIFVLFFLAPVYVPLDLLTGWIHTIAEVNPVTALLEAGRGFISGEPASVGLAFGLALALILAFAVWARGGLRRAEAAGG